MKISLQQLAGTPKVIGKLRGNNVSLISTKGGFRIVLVTENGKVRVLAATPHPGVSKFQAKKSEPDLEYNELSKSFDEDPALFQHLMPLYDQIVAEINKKL